MSQQDDRRHHPRVKRIQLAQLSRFDEEGLRADLATGRTLNISRGGIRLELHHALPLRSLLNLSLTLGDTILDVDGKVTYLEAIDDERIAMGVEFVDLTPEGQKLIDEFLTED